MYIIGISSGIKHGHHDGGATLMLDGKIVAASEEERFTLAKHARGELPIGSVKFCLQRAGITIQDVEWICSPLVTYRNYKERLEDYFNFQLGYCPKVKLFDHHLCHAASTYYASGFKEATVFGFDFSGDSASGLVIKAKDNHMEVIDRFERHNSLGLYYGMMTQFLGYKMTNDEYKVMGLASYGEAKYKEEFDKILTIKEHLFNFNSIYDKRQRDSHLFSSDFSTRQEQIFTDDLEKLLGPRRLAGSELTQRHKDIAASGQYQLEKITTHVVKEAIKNTGFPRVCIAGGVGLNVKMNQEISKLKEVLDIYVPPVPHDAGVSTGAAMLQCVEEGFEIEPMTHAYWGPEYDNKNIQYWLKQIQAKYVEVDNPEELAAENLANGKIIGWFQGRMEFGPRALGNRSILADPRSLDVKNRINATIKYREEYRPFCPSVLSEKQKDFFDSDYNAPFMNMNVDGLEAVKNKIPAVVHVDGTARIQSVHRDSNPMFHKLISEFDKRTGIPIVVNTSLNINEQPTTNAPIEAIHTYFCSGLDALYIGNFKLEK